MKFFRQQNYVNQANSQVVQKQEFCKWTLAPMTSVFCHLYIFLISWPCHWVAVKVSHIWIPFISRSTQRWCHTHTTVLLSLFFSSYLISHLNSSSGAEKLCLWGWFFGESRGCWFLSDSIQLFTTHSTFITKF